MTFGRELRRSRGDAMGKAWWTLKPTWWWVPVYILLAVFESVSFVLSVLFVLAGVVILSLLYAYRASIPYAPNDAARLVEVALFCVAIGAILMRTMGPALDTFRVVAFQPGSDGDAVLQYVAQHGGASALEAFLYRRIMFDHGTCERLIVLGYLTLSSSGNDIALTEKGRRYVLRRNLR